jgi:uncharacterized protein
MPPRTAPAWIERLVDYRWWLVALAAVIGVGSAVAGRRLVLDRSIENMFAADDPILIAYKRLQRTFGRQDVVLAMYADPDLKSPEGIDRVKALREKLRAAPGVVAVVSLVDLPGADNFENQNVGRRMREVFAGYTHNADFTAAGIMCLIERPGTGEHRRRDILAGMRAAIADYPQAALVGEAVLVEDAFDLLDVDGKRLTTWSTVLVMVVIVACFRSLRWLLLPLAVVQLALHSTKGLLVVSGLQLSMVSSMLAAIITVCGVAMVVHVMVHYLDVRREGQPRRAALIQTIDELKVPITWAILTDSAGFASLMVSKVGPIHDFGLMMAIGSFMTLPACALLLPGLAWVGDSGGLPPREKHGALTGVLMRMLRWSDTHAGTLALAAVAITVASVLGSQRLERETAFTKNFRQDTPVVKAYNFVEDQFGGAGVWDLLLPAPKTLDLRYLKQVIDLEAKLLADSAGQLTKAISVADAIDAARAIPIFRPSATMALSTMRGAMPEFTGAWYAADPEDGRYWVHVLLRAPERLPAEDKIALINSVQAAAAEQFPGAEATGYYVLLAELIKSVLDDQWKTFAVASAAVFVMTLMAFRNLPLALATMVPNAIPVLMLFGGMGWLGIKTNMGAAMIAAVSVGLSIDSSIHYVMLYQYRRRQGMTMDEALHHAQDSAGRAATLSTLALIVGFATLCASDFIPTIYFGALVSLSMIGGLVGNILVQPMLIRKLDRRVYA